MNVLKNVYLIGLGAIGGAFGSRILENCPESLHVVINSERSKRYSSNGVIINGKTVPFNYIQPEQIQEKADLVIIAVKQHHLDQTIADIKRLVGPDTILLSLLNGISSEEILGNEFGADKLLYSFCVGTDAVRVGTDIQFTNIGKIVFGDKENSGLSKKVEAVRRFFDRAQVPYHVPEDIIQELWWKFMLNVGINQVSALLRAPYGAFNQEGYARELMFEASREVIALAQKIGIHLTEEDIQKYAKIISTLSPEGKTSMLQDIEAGRKTEVEIFSGTVIQLGREYGIPTPVNDILFKLLRATEELVIRS